jgi:GTPase
MTEHQIINFERELAFLVGAEVRGSRPLLNVEDSLSELALLADTAGMKVIGQTSQHLRQIDPSTYIGSGKVEEIRDILSESDVKTVVFDDELSPRHQRELEKRFGEDIKIIDRTALILDIFAQHARTREGALQVELAQYEYRLPRLTRQWTHLARQTGGGAARGGTGGVGLRGPGETQLEVDRREIGRKISKLKEELSLVRAHRQRQRMQRDRVGVPVIALVGYTNAGKSTLLKTLTGADVYIADQLFATLDPTTRRIELPSGRHVLLTDTVGFIQKLPTTLIEAFQATLEGVAEADMLLHVVDSSHPNVVEHIEAVEDTLAEIDVPDIPRVLVWNKTDLVSSDDSVPEHLESNLYAAEVRVSARKRTGIDELLKVIETVLAASLRQVKLLLPYERGDLVSLLYDLALVQEQEHQDQGVMLKVQLPPSLYERFRQYQV